MLSVVAVPRERVPGSSSLTWTLTRTKTSSFTSFASTTSRTARTKRSSPQAGSNVSMPMILAEFTRRR